MQFRILGPLEVVDNGRALPLGSPRQRALLAYLLLHRNEVVARDRLVEALWGEERPARAENVVQVYVSRLRAVLSGRIDSAGGGYGLRVERDELDADEFERLVEEGTAELRAGQPERAEQTLHGALAIWRGDALADFTYEPFAQAEVTRLEEQRLRAVEARIDAELALARHAELVHELRHLAEQHPHRERIVGQLMLALYRSGRQTEALDVFASARRALVGELGLEPGPALRERHAAILRQDPELDVEPPELRARRRLPAPATPLVGRRDEIDRVVALLRGDARLVTLTGTGGIGKTRVALQAAWELAAWFTDGVVFAGLAALRDPALVAAELAGSLDVDTGAGSPQEALAEHLRARSLLLVVDNFEQVDEAAHVLSSLLSAAPEVKVLVTSRHPLRLYGEHEHRVPPLALEDEAVPLFLQRAEAAGGRAAASDAVREICRRLDRLPLAIELAAGRARDLAPADLLAALARPLELAAAGPRDVAERQRTMHAAIEWSWELLADGDRRLFEDLAIFAGGWDTEAADAVSAASAEDLDRLAVRNLITAAGDRFDMLATVREFAAERLEQSGRAAALRARHARYYAELAATGDEALAGGSDAARWLDRLEVEHDNLRAALDVAAESDPELELRLVTALGRFWEWRGHVREGLDRLECALARPAAAGPPTLRVRALMRAGVFLHMRGDFVPSRRRLEEGLALARELGDEAAVANALRNLGTLAKDEGDLERATALHSEALELSRAVGDPAGISSSLINLADAALAAGDFGHAAALARESVDLARELGHAVRETMSLLNLGLALLGSDDTAGAAATFGLALELCEQLTYREGAAVCFVGLAALTAADDPRSAARMLGAADGQLESAGAVLESGEREVAAQALGAASRALDGTEIRRARSEGAALSLGDAIGEARACAEALRVP